MIHLVCFKRKGTTFYTDPTAINDLLCFHHPSHLLHHSNEAFPSTTLFVDISQNRVCKRRVWFELHQSVSNSFNKIRIPTIPTRTEYGFPYKSMSISLEHFIENLTCCLDIQFFNINFQVQVPRDNVFTGNVTEELQCIVRRSGLQVKIDTTVTQKCIGNETEFYQLGVNQSQRI
ncbi:hypothetical protein MIMGU_mgv1a014921mg [Erythranthe guttata]|uniref:Uncharacterized protein n=1 Tax=Erythranthe guttata TaxID=4155 RepID=A0A022Q7A8_ERYGU|nr:hypothetical protein MIMGU_mgv1a014921mg [Erythranthe guttata]